MTTLIACPDVSYRSRKLHPRADLADITSMKLSWFAASVAFVGVLGFARAQAVQASEEARWNDAVTTFAAAVSGAADKTAIQPLVTDHSIAEPFARNRVESVSVLPDRLANLSFVSAHAYLQPAISAASDLVADLEARADIDPAIKRRLIPAERKDLHNADATMARWFGTALKADVSTPVAIVTLYDPGQQTVDGTTKPTLVFVLLRGAFDPDGLPIIEYALYGSLEAAVR